MCPLVDTRSRTLGYSIFTLKKLPISISLPKYRLLLSSYV
jgi:hypothetical protein